MAVIMTSLKVVLFCSVAVVIFCSQETNAWGRFRIRVPRIRIPRISLPRITLPRIRLPRIRLPRIRLPRIRLPRIRLSLMPFYGITSLLFPVIKLPPIKLPGSDPVCLDVNFRHLLPIGKISCDDSIPTPPSAPVVDPCSLIVSRSEWGAPSISESEHLVLPMAMIAMYLGGHNCSTRHECTEEAKKLYKEEENYNFMIGGDGTIFQGRGWHTFSDHYSSYGRIEYGVVFLGESISQKMYLAFMYWIRCGSIGGMLPKISPGRILLQEYNPLKDDALIILAHFRFE